MYLLNTNVISATAPDKPSAFVDPTAWLHSNSDGLYLSTITIAEIELGIAKARRASAGTRADRLRTWLEVILHLYDSRIIPLDIRAARVLGPLSDLTRSSESNPGYADLAIAAIAISRGYTVLTRNLHHFQDMPVACHHHPFASLPAKPG